MEKVVLMIFVVLFIGCATSKNILHEIGDTSTNILHKIGIGEKKKDIEQQQVADVKENEVSKISNLKIEEPYEVITKNQILIFETTHGNFEVELNYEKAPISVKNFMAYVNEGFYNGTIFHKVINGFMVQGGGFDMYMKKKPTKSPIKNEAGNGLKNYKYTIAMARTDVIDSATSQFFINVSDNSSLDHSDNSNKGFGYAVFGKVTSGFDTIDNIKEIDIGTSGPHVNVPAEPIIINNIYKK